MLIKRKTEKYPLGPKAQGCKRTALVRTPSNTVMAVLVLLVVGCLCVGGECFAADDANASVVGGASEAERQGETGQAKCSEGQVESSAVETAEAGRAEAYKESVGHLKWSLGIIVGLVVGLIIYTVFTNKREYKDALAEAREAARNARDACKEARESSERAMDCEEKAQKQLRRIDDTVKAKLSEIDEVVIAKLREIEKEGREALDNLVTESKKQLEVSEAWSVGLRAMQKEDYEEAAREFEKVALKTKSAEAYNNWGVALRNLAERKEGAEGEELFAEAFEKHGKAVDIKKDFHETYNNWGSSLLKWARRKTGNEREECLHEAVAILMKGEGIKRGGGAYNLACAWCMLGDEGKCREWLKVGEEEGTLTTKKEAMEDADMEAVRDKQWFKDMRWKGE